jgi:hypothetical protein
VNVNTSAGTDVRLAVLTTHTRLEERLFFAALDRRGSRTRTGTP